MLLAAPVFCVQASFANFYMILGFPALLTNNDIPNTGNS
jgi:hypothetical protein